MLANLQAFGRRPIMLFSLLFFAAGSAACGAAPNMNALIAGRSEMCFRRFVTSSWDL